jgi:methyl-accepting chemotaxis protein
MEQSLYLLLGAGVFITILSIFIKNPAAGPADSKAAQIQKQLERAEMEKSLQRFVHQVKKENEQVITGMQKKNQTLHEIVAFLQERLANVEQGHSALRDRLDAFDSNQVKLEQAAATMEEEQTDTLMLKERYRRVFELKEQGMQIEEIAKKLGAGQGEIELIFSLAQPPVKGRTHA